jgi:hypothetical protein
MAEPRHTLTRRAILSYDRYKSLYKEAVPSITLPDLLVKDYQGIFQDFVFTVGEIDNLEVRVEKNEQDIIEIKEDIVDLQLRVAALEYRVYKNVSTTISLTTEEFQIILCKNTSPIEITLKTDPIDGDEISVIRANGSVKVIGTINGKVNLTLNIKGSGPKFVYDAAALTWWKI